MSKRILVYLVATVTWFMFTASTCEGLIVMDRFEGGRFLVRNNTSDTLVWIEGISYPDALLDIDCECTWRIIPPNRAIGVTYGVDWINYEDLRAYFSLQPYGYSTEVFISLDTIKKYGWEDVVKNNRIYQRYDLCYDDVAPIQASMESYDYNSWELWFSVPPTDCMKDVKMWPPYGHYEIIGQ